MDEHASETATGRWQITALEPDPRSPNRVLVTISPVEAHDGAPNQPRSFPVAVVVIAEQGLRTGTALDAAGLAALQAADTFQQLYSRVLDLLAIRPRSESELRTRLRRKGVADEDIERVIARLRRAGYLDDAAFARYWIGERARSRPRGPRLMRQELRNKGVAPAVVDTALAEARATRIEEATTVLENMPAEDAADESVASDPEYEDALRLARRRLRGYASLDPPTFRRRVAALLVRQGFSYATARRVLATLAADQDDDVADDA